MTAHMRALLLDRRGAAPRLAAHGLATIRARHTCAHRVDELLGDLQPTHATRAVHARAHVKIAFFGSSLVSAYWNGAATYYRGMIRALHDARARRHVLRARRVRAAAASRHRGSAVGARRRLRRTAPTAWQRALDAAARMPTSSSRRAASACSIASSKKPCWIGPSGHARGLLGRRCARHARSARCRSARSVPSRCVPRYDLVLTYGGGEPVRRAYLGAWRARVRADLQRARSGDALSGCRPIRASRAISRSSATACPTARRASTSSSSPRPRRCPSTGSCSAAAAGTTSRAAERAYTSATSTPPITTRSTARRRRCSTSAATAWRATASRRRRGVFEAAGAGACLITDAWEGIDQFLEPGREVLVAHDGDEVAGSCATADARGRARDRRGGAAARARRRTPTRTARRRSSALLARTDGGRMSDAPAHRHSRPDHHVVVGQRPRDDVPRARSRARAARARRLVPRTRRAVVRGEPRPAAARRTAAPSSIRASTSCAIGSARDVRDADLVIVGSYVPDGIEVGDWVLRDRARRHRVLRHRYARHAGGARSADSART